MMGAFGIIFLFPTTLCFISGQIIYGLIWGIMSLTCFIMKIQENNQR